VAHCDGADKVFTREEIAKHTKHNNILE
jgi:hypothetical protein